MSNEKINELKSLDKYFPKGKSKKRGEAIIVAVEAFLLGKESMEELK